MSEPKNRELAIVVTVAIVLTFAALDFLTPQLIEGNHGVAEWLFVFPFGALAAQVMLISAWAVFAPVNIVVRFASWLLFGLMTWYLLVFGEASTHRALGRPNEEGVVVLGILLLLGATLLQGPMWLAKLAVRYRLLAPGESTVDPRLARLQFQLKDLLLAMLIVAIALSPLRLILPKEGVGRLPPVPELPELLIVLAVCFAFVLVGTFPSFWVAFSKRATLALALALAFYALFLAVGEFLIACAIAGSPPNAQMGFEAIGIAFAANFAQGAVVFTVMRIYYALGFRLRRVRRDRFEQAPSASLQIEEQPPESPCPSLQSEAQPPE